MQLRRDSLCPWYGTPIPVRCLAQTDFCLCFRSISEIRRAIPERLFKRDTTRASFYLVRDLIMAALMWASALNISNVCDLAVITSYLGKSGTEVLRWMLWLA